jgi:hypothetical protein
VVPLSPEQARRAGDCDGKRAKRHGVFGKILAFIAEPKIS